MLPPQLPSLLTSSAPVDVAAGADAEEEPLLVLRGLSGTPGPVGVAKISRRAGIVLSPTKHTPFAGWHPLPQ